MATRSGSPVVLRRDGVVLFLGLPIGRWEHDYVPVAMSDYQLRWWAAVYDHKTPARRTRRAMVRDIESIAVQAKSLGSKEGV